ncbi:MAG: methyltransferase domain-containing protein [Actinomycetota bacterium]|nr:methyltransferase domain-containing protein [Actinomycetota bacterium]
MNDGEGLNWRDGAETSLKAILSGADDRSTASDELAGHIQDWPSRYHLDRRRTNLLRPIRLGSGVRILDAGAGTGVMSRYAAEAGATVVAVEGDQQRAELAKLRCEGTGVDVRCCSIADIDDSDGFDVVLAVGVLEYSERQHGGAVSFLNRLARLVRPGGILALAIENQLGLAYLLGANEDHLGRPWVGLEGYQTSESGVRTFSRTTLNKLLAGAGLTHQRWLYPFPDYKLPVAILAEDVYTEIDAIDLVDQMVGPPVARDRTGGTVDVDTRAVHREFVAAGIGPEVANSFLVLAATDPTALETRSDTSTLAWHFTGDRRRCYLNERRVTNEGGHRRIDRARSHPGQPPPASWLAIRERHPDIDRYLAGPNLEQLTQARLRAHDIDGLRGLLGEFDSWVGSQAEARPASSNSHPYLPTGSGLTLPGNCIDAGFDNLVPNGAELVLVDEEWWAEGGVDCDLVTVRALWKLAWRTVSSGTRHPWPSTTSVEKLTLTLFELYPRPLPTDLLERFYLAEAELVAVACGGDPGDHHESLREEARSTGFSDPHKKVSKGFRSRFSRLKHLPGGRRLAEWTRPR